MSSSSSSRHLYSSLYLLYVSINKQLIIFQNFFGVLSRLSQDKGYKTFPQLKCLRGATERCDAGKHVARELRVGGAYSKVTGKTELKYFTWIINWRNSCHHSVQKIVFFSLLPKKYGKILHSKSQFYLWGCMQYAWQRNEKFTKR